MLDARVVGDAVIGLEALSGDARLLRQVLEVFSESPQLRAAADGRGDATDNGTQREQHGSGRRRDSTEALEAAGGGGKL